MIDGENIFDVAQKLKLDVDFLKQLNKNIDSSYIVIPADMDSSFMRYTVKQGDTVYSIASMYNIDYRDLLTLNGLNMEDYIYPNQEIMIPSNNTRVYITKQFDTLDKIADNFNTGVSDIIGQNPNLYLVEDQVVVYKD